MWKLSQERPPHGPGAARPSCLGLRSHTWVPGSGAFTRICGCSTWCWPCPHQVRIGAPRCSGEVGEPRLWPQGAPHLARLTRVHTCTYTATAAHTHICMHVHSHAQAHTQAHTGPHTCTHVHRYTLVSAHSCTNTLMCICTAQSPARGHVHTHARTCTPREQATLQCTAGGPVPADCNVQGRTELRCLRPRSWGGLSCPWVPAWVGASRGNCLPRARGEAEGVWAGGQAGGSGMQLVTSRSWAGRAARGPSTQKMPPRQPASPGPLNANEE